VYAFCHSGRANRCCESRGRPNLALRWPRREQPKPKAQALSRAALRQPALSNSSGIFSAARPEPPNLCRRLHRNSRPPSPLSSYPTTSSGLQVLRPSSGKHRPPPIPSSHLSRRPLLLHRHLRNQLPLPSSPMPRLPLRTSHSTWSTSSAAGVHPNQADFQHLLNTFFGGAHAQTFIAQVNTFPLFTEKRS
jgi:hypothetical protein